jgi:predicted amidohydrolase YtcJ
VSNERKARNRRGDKIMPWRSEIWAGFELDFGSDQETLDPEAEAWIEATTVRLWRTS